MRGSAAVVFSIIGPAVKWVPASEVRRWPAPDPVKYIAVTKDYVVAEPDWRDSHDEWRDLNEQL